MKSFRGLIGGLFKSGNISDEALVKQFSADPTGFLAAHPVNAFSILPAHVVKSDLNRNDGIYPFTLSADAKGKEVFLVLNMQAEALVAIPAYYLPYVANVTSKADVPSVLVDKKDPKVPFIFTGTLTGCSFIVEDEGSRLRVYHDPRPYETNSELSEVGVKGEYQNVIAVFQPDQMEYRDDKGLPHTVGFAMMHYDYKQGGWLLLGQALKFAETDKQKGVQHFTLNDEKQNPIVCKLVQRSNLAPE